MILSREVFVFFEAIVLGALLGALYDVFRIIRIAFFSPKILVFFEDVLYFVLLTIASFLFIVSENDGVLRSFLILGELIGAILYFLTLSRLVMRLARWLIRLTCSIGKALYRVFIRPVLRVIKKLFCLLGKLGKRLLLILTKCGRKVKKLFKRKSKKGT